MNFNDTGTLIDWPLEDTDVIAPLQNKQDGGSRGGVYLCIPNFEALPPPFAIKHGEYRMTPCDNTLPHRKTLAGTTEADWGKVEVITDWTEHAGLGGKVLTVSCRIRALSDIAWIRPGFHPYFSVSPGSVIDIGAEHIDIAEMPHDQLQVHHAASLAEPATIRTADYTVAMTCGLSPLREGLCLAYGVWSDKSTEYVCIEPIIGCRFGADGLPAPFSLSEGEEFAMTFTIHAERLGFLK